jgi:tRNA(adenine34) deaminase
MLARTDGQSPDQSVIDIDMMRRCIALSAEAIKRGEFPFAAIVAEGSDIVVEATNAVAQNGDVTRHAELPVLSDA